MPVTTQVLKNIYRFNNQRFYGEDVGVYLIDDAEDRLVLLEIPEFNKETLDYLRKFNKPIECYLSHGSTGISDGDEWKKNIDMKIYLHEGDRGHSWLRIEPDEYLSGETDEIFNSLNWIHTSGHSEGSICLYHEETKTFFSGDMYYANSQGELEFTDDMHYGTDEGIEEIKQQIKDMSIENVLPFHYGTFISGARLRKDFGR